MIHDFATIQRESSRSNVERRAVQAPVITPAQRSVAPAGDMRSPVAWSGANRTRRLEAAAASRHQPRTETTGRPVKPQARADAGSQSAPVSRSQSKLGAESGARVSAPARVSAQASGLRHTLTPLLSCWLHAFASPRVMVASAVAMVVLVIGLFGTFPEDDASQAGGVADFRATAAPNSVAHAEIVSKPRFVIDTSEAEESQFGFYESLRASPWEVPVQRGVYITEADRKRYNQRYILQAASVRGRNEAESLVRKLKAAGLNASWQSAAGNSHGWHRVMVGPFSNVSVMNKAEDILVSLHMMPLKLKVD